MFRITVIEVTGMVADGLPLPDITRYEQTVDAIDLAALTAMVNRKPRVYTKRKAAVDNGK